MLKNIILVIDKVIAMSWVYTTFLGHSVHV